jgi:hypothetical protein
METVSLQTPPCGGACREVRLRTERHLQNNFRCPPMLGVIRKEAWSFYRTSSVSAYVGSSKKVKDLQGARRT